ncbi:cytochrome oxidase complex assembly protein 1-domain-containing protein [Lasiosphaeria ovina]|uniref:Cytochrome oxidase complex assembly protein 1-domain-containing protein n=1 Tax=Lasiosphaeria ovina TaxID=92902 RepID=A0AAE0N7Z9_9PEZI|nr:cytochrome oxidase complex assembly protein 1-domain-containing protein [Lasiosphaeria ovina]
MLSRTAHPRRAGTLAAAALRRTSPGTARQRRTLVSAPRPGDGPLMERRADRELPNIDATSHWRRTLPAFLAILALSSVAIFNYQKLSSPVVSSTLYALRTNRKARAYLGDEIYFAQQIPWISGTMNQLHGRIDIRFAVRGTRGSGWMRFASSRATPRAQFETLEWSLETADGRVIDLLEGEDPFRGITGPGEAGFGGGRDVGEDDDDEETRGFRQMIAVQVREGERNKD